MGKRKRRTALSSDALHKNKRVKRAAHTAAARACPQPEVSHPLLNACYSFVTTLKDYISATLPPSSSTRRKRLAAWEVQRPENHSFLNSTLVTSACKPSPSQNNTRLHQLSKFTQTQREAKGCSATAQSCTLDEVVDFVIWSLFHCLPPGERRPKHLLCHGLERSITDSRADLDWCRPVLPGVLQRYQNSCVAQLKQQPWRQLMSITGADGQAIFSTLLFDCSIFIVNQDSVTTFTQLSGPPLHDLCLERNINDRQHRVTCAKRRMHSAGTQQPRKLNEICFVRSRCFYSKPSTNRDKTPSVGLPHMHILNRLHETTVQAQEVIVLQYIFPRQFKLHNVFTSSVDRHETTQPFKDYTFRDEVRIPQANSHSAIPARLRNGVLKFVRKLRRNHKSCSYSQLLAHYCPVKRRDMLHTSCHSLRSDKGPSECRRSIRTQDTTVSSMNHPRSSSQPETFSEQEASFLSYATPCEQVSAFCQAALRTILPRNVLGRGVDGAQNWRILLKHVDRFVHMRKFETTNLHAVAQCLKLKSIEWLAPHPIQLSAKLSITDKIKREELLHESLYYIIDSLLIPLIAGSFYVTETGTHRNQLAYFRHDVWRRLCEPTISSLCMGILKVCPSKHIRNPTGHCELGHSFVRFLPKDSGVRPIVNLKRRSMKFVNGRAILLPSINTQLTPVFNILNYERQQDRGGLKIDRFSLQDLSARLALFKNNLGGAENFYFVKVDIRSAFDSIPQQKLLDLVRELFQRERYYTTKHAESRVRPASSEAVRQVKFVKSAWPAECPVGLVDALPKPGVVYNDIDQRQSISRQKALALLQTHIQANTIRIGNKYYQQRQGIPQGSILSSLLCTFFYDDFERNRLDFLSRKSSLLLRVIDDFLLITTRQIDAMRFVQAMKAGDASYGIYVHPAKSLVNFELTLDGASLPKLVGTTAFPYCGLHIDTKSLQISKDRIRKDNTIANTLTVDMNGHAGDKFKRRVLSSMRIQLQTMLLDSRLNSRERVLQTLLECFGESAMKLHQYSVQMPKLKRPTHQLLISIVEQLVSLVFRTIRRVSANVVHLTRPQVCCLAACALLRTLSARHTSYGPFLQWLSALRTETQHTLNLHPAHLESIVESGHKSVEHYIF